MPSDPEKLRASCEFEAWEKLAENEATALTLMLENDHTKITVMVIASFNDGEQAISITTSSIDSSPADLAVFQKHLIHRIRTR